MAPEDAMLLQAFVTENTEEYLILAVGVAKSLLSFHSHPLTVPAVSPVETAGRASTIRQSCTRRAMHKAMLFSIEGKLLNHQTC